MCTSGFPESDCGSEPDFSNSGEEFVEVYRAAGLLEASALVQLLNSSQIATMIQGIGVSPITNEVPVRESSPRIWVAASQADSAKVILGQWENERRERSHSPFAVSGWTCPRCGTDVEAQFDTCWNCRYSPRSC
ncbi:MAG: DUF2007 domain-containing protein [Planctomycetaceae bacterium]